MYECMYVCMYVRPQNSIFVLFKISNEHPRPLYSGAPAQRTCASRAKLVTHRSKTFWLSRDVHLYVGPFARPHI